MIGQTQKVFYLLSWFSLTIQGLGGFPVRLSGGKYFEGGFVEIWDDGEWRTVCDPGRNTWNKKAGDAVCHELGFMESLNTFHGDTGLWTASRDMKSVSHGIECKGGEQSLSKC